MDSAQILKSLERLDDEIDDLEEALQPITDAPLIDTISKLPLLDKAKLYINVTYSIESMLFSYLRLYGVKARDHPVFRELTRVKQYFEKLKNAENPVQPRENLTLDKKAAARFITAGLRGNDQYDLARAEQLAKEKAKAHIKFQQVSNASKLDSSKTNSSEQDDSSDSSSSAEEQPTKQKKRKHSDDTPVQADIPVTNGKKLKKDRSEKQSKRTTKAEKAAVRAAKKSKKT